MKSNVIGRFVIVFTIIFLGGMPSAWAQEKCSGATMRGEYRVTGRADPRFDQRDDPSYPRIVTSTWNFDGGSELSAFAIQNFGGTIMRVENDGTYTMSSDRCVLVVRFPNTAGGETVWEGLINFDGSEGDLIRVDTDTKGRATIANRHLKKR
jgi:hypothetical protein